MKNNIYDLINDGGFNADMYGEIKLNDIESKKMKNRFNKSKNNTKGKYKKVAAGFVAAIAVSGVFLCTEAGAQAITTVTRTIEGFLITNKNLDDYKTILNESVYDNGFTIKINEVIINDNKIVISRNISWDKIFNNNEEDYPDTMERFYINGKEIDIFRGSGLNTKIDKNTVQNISKFNLNGLDNMDLSEDLDVKIVYDGMVMSMEDKALNLDGHWEFNFKVSKDVVKKAIEANKKSKIDYEFVLPNGEKIVLEEYTNNNIDKKVFARKENASPKEEYDIALLGTDNLGNRVEFYGSEDVNKNYVFGYNLETSSLDEKSTKIKLKPYAVRFDNENYRDDYEAMGEDLK